MRASKITLGLCAAALLVVRPPLAAQAPQAQASPAAKLPAAIPLFPLEDAALFPRAARPFHIFEPRYRAMIADALKGDRIIGMVTLQPGFESNYGGRPPVYAVGCAGVIEEVDELPDGRYNILLRGLVKFRIDGEDQTRAYRLASVTAIPEPTVESQKDAIHKQRERLEVLLTMPGSDRAIPPDVADEEVIDAVAQYVPMDPKQRQALLELEGALSRGQALVELLESKSAPPR
jgi:Lon protease-like protein